MFADNEISYRKVQKGIIHKNTRQKQNLKKKQKNSNFFKSCGSKFETKSKNQKL